MALQSSKPIPNIVPLGRRKVKFLKKCHSFQTFPYEVLVFALMALNLGEDIISSIHWQKVAFSIQRQDGKRSL
jgi:hypothetical protein